MTEIERAEWIKHVMCICSNNLNKLFGRSIAIVHSSSNTPCPYTSIINFNIKQSNASELQHQPHPRARIKRLAPPHLPLVGILRSTSQAPLSRTHPIPIIESVIEKTPCRHRFQYLAAGGECQVEERSGYSEF